MMGFVHIWPNKCIYRISGETYDNFACGGAFSMLKAHTQIRCPTG